MHKVGLYYILHVHNPSEWSIWGLFQTVCHCYLFWSSSMLSSMLVIFIWVTFHCGHVLRGLHELESSSVGWPPIRGIFWTKRCKAKSGKTPQGKYRIQQQNQNWQKRKRLRRIPNIPFIHFKKMFLQQFGLKFLVIIFLVDIIGYFCFNILSM